MINFDDTLLGNVAEIIPSNVDKKIIAGEKMIRLCNYMDVYNNRYLSSRIVYSVGSASLSEVVKFSLKEDDVIITKDSETPEDIAVPSVVVEDMPNLICGYHLALVRPKVNIAHGEFLMHLLQTQPIKKQFSNKANGSTRYGLTIDSIKNVRLDLPPLPVQRKIASILSTIDGQIEKTEVIIAKYQAVKQGMLQDLFTRGIDVRTGQLRRLDDQDSQQNREYFFPREWACVKVGSYLLKIEQGWSPNCDDTVALVNEWGVLKTTAVRWEGYSDQENKKLPTSLKPRKEYEVKEEDVLVTRAGPNSRVGVITFVEKTRSHLIFSDKIYRLSPSVDIMPAFLSLTLSSNYTQSHLSTFKTGMAESQTNISQNIVKTLEVLLPSVNEQRLIVDKITSINSLIDSEKRTLSKLQVLKQGLMQDLLSGKVEVKA